MKKIGLSAAVILVFIAYSFQQRSDTESSVITPKQTSPSTSSVSTAKSPSSTQSNTTPSSNMSNSMMNSKYKDGSYTGTAADAFYGYIQVRAVISGGKITDVQFLQYPNDRRDSVAINTQAMPLLKQEAIQAQSANVNGVTGASDTSQAFVESLTSALNKAQQG